VRRTSTGVVMARKPVSVFKRPMTVKGQYRFYVQTWDESRGVYATARSAASVAVELGLDAKSFPPTSRTGALLIGEELRRRGGSQPRKAAPLFSDYLKDFWDWKTSSYVQGKQARGQCIGQQYVSDNAARVANYIRPAFPSIKLAAVRPYMLEDFAMKLKQEDKLGNRSINAILQAISVPLHEAARLGLIASDPAASIRKLSNDTAEKGIPTEEEVRGLLTLPGLDLRTRAAIMLGTACALRIGECLALKAENIGESTLTVASSWSVLDGMKSTKTGRVRVVPLPGIVRKTLLALDEENPHGKGGFLFYGLKPDAPLDVRALERLVEKAMIRLTLGDKYNTATREEKDTALASWKARNITFHSLRHWSNAMLRGTVSDAKLHLLTGHATEAMTERYDHATESDLAELAQAQTTKILPFLKAIGA
jgi:integrase